MRRQLVILLALISGACSSTYSDQVSFLDGDRFYAANIRTFTTRVTGVDGKTTLARENPVRVEPGEHVIRVVTAPTAGFSAAEPREMKLLVEPCKRYYIVAVRDNRLLQDWEPVLEYVGPSGGRGCP
jgi:hypothetical protein